ncbi:hypothetical protein SAMN04487936_101456 [Halobacillus dabanensis]|uniref:Uncharacterized protein n=1 Tax=Halobacillus dabanensis TaxID=240302 RepID=A0A1I3PX42_HALDA|nr:hypothetical protein [Halobacillus dabanensis]SFJ25761.1 hypothetical protein SAMN04487936_101456 [Halobacillus dabanensis]
MKRMPVFVFVLVLFLFGCSSQQEKLINDLKPRVDDRYSVFAFKDEETSSEEFQSKINEVFNDAEVWENKLYAFEIYDRIPTEPYDYQKLLKIEKRPAFIVIDSEGIAFRTHNLTELENFFFEE